MGAAVIALTLTLTSDPVKVISACATHRTTSIPKNVTVALCNTEMWPFESPVVSTFCKV